MADPRPLNRKELAEFLPNQRAIRAFEKLFELIPSDLEELLLLVQSANLSTQSIRSETNQLKREIAELQVELNSLSTSRKQVLQLQQKIRDLSVELQALPRSQNLDSIIKRIEVLETLEG